MQPLTSAASFRGRVLYSHKPIEAPAAQVELDKREASGRRQVRSMRRAYNVDVSTVTPPKVNKRELPCKYTFFYKRC
jgi:hypothetical protein